MASSKEISFVVSLEEKNRRLDQFLAKRLKNTYPTRFIRKRIEEKGCFVNGEVERFPSRKVQEQDTIVFSLEKAKKPSFSILFEDTELLCIEKEAGLLSSLSSFGLQKGFLVHRLDKETSGVLLIAKTPLARKELAAQFYQKKVEKRYLALVQGEVSLKKGKIEGLYAKKRQFHGNSLWGTSSTRGTVATTLFRTMQKKRGVSLLEVAPKTGKTHQIRAHLSEIGHPIIGDCQYGKREGFSFFSKRTLLHAWKICFFHPLSKEKIFLVSSVPQDFLEALNFFEISTKDLSGQSFSIFS